MNAPATITPNLPALIDALPRDSAQPQQTEFTRARQVAFLSALASSGAVRRAVKAAGVAHQTAYRMRRASAAFRLAWDAALLAARALAEDVLASRAIEGVEEKVYYHGEEIATRTRYSDRLLLAHLGRLDRLTGDARVNAFAEDFEEGLARFERGEEQPEVAPATSGHERGGGGKRNPGFSSSGLCNNRSMSNMPPCDCASARHGTDGGQPHFEMTGQGPQPVINVDGSGPCCDRPRWPQCRDCPHYPPVDRLFNAMRDARPADAPPPDELGDSIEVELCQAEAWMAGEDEWWLLGERRVRFGRNADGAWRPESELAVEEPASRVRAPRHAPAAPRAADGEGQAEADARAGGASGEDAPGAATEAAQPTQEGAPCEGAAEAATAAAEAEPVKPRRIPRIRCFEDL